MSSNTESIPDPKNQLLLEHYTTTKLQGQVTQVLKDA